MAKMLRGQSRKGGFTLIELMIVIAIIGILAAIAIPQFTVNKKGGFNAAAKADAKNTFTAAQAYFNEHPTGAIGSAADLQPFGFNATANVTTTAVGTVSTLAITSSHASGSATYSVTSAGIITP